MPRARSGRRLLAVVTACAAVLAGVLTLPAANAVAAPVHRSAVAAPGPAPAVPQRYLAQRIAWTPCFDEVPEELPAGSERLQCGTFDVPRDWRRPAAGVDLSIAVTRLNPAGRRAPRTVLTNPGGPGGPGRALPLLYLDAKRTALTSAREIVGIDPRGTGASTNATCKGGVGIGQELDPRDRSAANLRLLLDSAALTARMCQQGGRALSRYITTEQTVRDLDLLRALLARPTVDWIGYSAGTWLGAAYATYFPKRVGRFVLDGNVDFTAPWQRTFALQPLGFQRRWERDFLPWAAAQPSTYGLGSTPAQVRASYEALRARAAREPIDLFGLLQVGPTMLDDLVLQSLYDKQAFPDLADSLGLLRQLAAGQQLPAAQLRRLRAAAAELRSLQGQRGALRPVATADALDATYYDVACNDTRWVGNRASLLRESARQQARYPLAGPYAIKAPCVFWDRSGLTSLAPRTGVGAPPVLMVQNDRDPATPVEGATHARRTFRGARMLTVVDEGNHTIYPGNACVDTKVERFLLGAAAAADATCLGSGLPPVVPEPGGARAVLRTQADGVQAAGTQAAGTQAGGTAGRRTDSGSSPLVRGTRLAEIAGLR